jgi:hypothetical protein
MDHFDDISFYSRAGFNAAHLGRYLPGGYWGLKEYFALAWSQAADAIDALEPGRRYAAEDLCGTGLWARLWLREALLLGRCVKFFVTHGLLPLIEANPDKKGKRMYVLDLEALARWRSRRGLVPVG